MQPSQACTMVDEVRVVMITLVAINAHLSPLKMKPNETTEDHQPPWLCINESTLNMKFSVICCLMSLW